MPPRKKPTTDAGAAPATGRKRTAKPAGNGDGATGLTRKPRAAGAAVAKAGHNLVIVESPSKAKTINKYLGSNFTVLASYGHVRDLPRRRKKGEKVAGVDIEAGWVPTYEVVEREEGKSRGRRSAKDILAELKREAKKSANVYLATDPDREGEAIAWHIEQALGLDEDSTFRVAFNEITRSAVQQAMASPGHINMSRVQAQEARRLLDRVVGYPLSNLLGKKVARGSSAGRVQSVALRLVVDREREIEAFKPEEYWKVTALLAPSGTVGLPARPLSVVKAEKPTSNEPEPEADGDAAKKKPKEKAKALPEGTYQAELAEWAGAKFDPKAEADAMAAAQRLETARYVVTKLEQKDRSRRADPPFTTSALQQQAANRLHFTAQRTMQTAQRLYEGVPLGSEGQVALITYMRTDSTRVSNEALTAVRSFIGGEIGAAYLPDKPNYYASGKSAQEAHEAIRPTDVTYTPDRVAQLGLHGEQLRLYTLIWQRFVASQMTPAVYAVTNVEVLATPTEGEQKGLFKATGSLLKFDGYLKVMPRGKSEEAELPPLKVDQVQDRLDLVASQHFTKPPPRYNEGSLIKKLEAEGIGRPSTYATIIGKITSAERGYIEVRERRFHATDIGKRVTDLLVEHFPDVMNLKFTSHFEEELDDIETGKMSYRAVLDEFWGPFSTALAKAEEAMPSQRGRETGEMCPKCGRPLVENFSKKTGRNFVGCSGWKEGCKYIKPAEGEEAKPEPVLTEFTCPNCNKQLERVAGRWGDYLRCTGYPECKTNLKIDAEGKPVQTAKPTEYTCEKCGKPMVLREGRRGPFLACTGYPKCKNAKDVDASGKPIEPADLGIACEKCNSPMAVRKGPRGPFLGCTAYPKCRNYKALTKELREQLNLPAPPAKKETPQVEIRETCPECGGPMKARQGRRGWFLGCAKYPKCKGVREAPPEVL
ncbi:MAG: type I DNA topoisomerase, partial [Gemmataceae bacterium]